MPPLVGETRSIRRERRSREKHGDVGDPAVQRRQPGWIPPCPSRPGASITDEFDAPHSVPRVQGVPEPSHPTDVRPCGPTPTTSVPVLPFQPPAHHRLDPLATTPSTAPASRCKAAPGSGSPNPMVLEHRVNGQSSVRPNADSPTAPFVGLGDISILENVPWETAKYPLNLGLAHASLDSVVVCQRDAAVAVSVGNQAGQSRSPDNQPEQEQGEPETPATGMHSLRITRHRHVRNCRSRSAGAATYLSSKEHLLSPERQRPTALFFTCGQRRKGC